LKRRLALNPPSSWPKNTPWSPGEILLWLPGDLALQQGNIYGINLYAYTAVRSHDINDEKRVADSVSRIETAIQEALKQAERNAAEELTSRTITVWQDSDRNTRLTDLVEQLRKLLLPQRTDSPE
jgi:hypothetical protein